MTDEQKKALPADMVVIRESIVVPGTWVVAQRKGGLVLVLTAVWFPEGKTYHLKSIIDFSIQDLNVLNSTFSEITI
jgi:hypothetical protein